MELVGMSHSYIFAPVDDKPYQEVRFYWIKSRNQWRVTIETEKGWYDVDDYFDGASSELALTLLRDHTEE